MIQFNQILFQVCWSLTRNRVYKSSFNYLYFYSHNN